MTYITWTLAALSIAYLLRLVWEVWHTLTLLVELDERRREANE